MTQANLFEPTDINVLLRAEKISTGKKTDSLFIPGEEKKKDGERYSFFVESIGSEVGAGREPYFNRVDIKKGDEVWVKPTAQPFVVREDDNVCMVSTHDILGVKRVETEA